VTLIAVAVGVDVPDPMACRDLPGTGFGAFSIRLAVDRPRGAWTWRGVGRPGVLGVGGECPNGAPYTSPGWNPGLAKRHVPRSEGTPHSPGLSTGAGDAWAEIDAAKNGGVW